MREPESIQFTTPVKDLFSLWLLSEMLSPEMKIMHRASLVQDVIQFIPRLNNHGICSNGFFTLDMDCFGQFLEGDQEVLSVFIDRLNCSVESTSEQTPQVFQGDHHVHRSETRFLSTAWILWVESALKMPVGNSLMQDKISQALLQLAPNIHQGRRVGHLGVIQGGGRNTPKLG